MRAGSLLPRGQWWRGLAAECALRRDRLDRWDRDFLRALMQQRQAATPRQLMELNAIVLWVRQRDAEQADCADGRAS